MKLFETLAGTSSDHFKIGDVDFMAAPLTLREYGEYLALPQGMIDAKAEYLADKLRRRVRGNKTDPATITEDWVMEHLELPMVPVLEHLLLYGKLPEDGALGKP